MVQSVEGSDSNMKVTAIEIDSPSYGTTTDSGVETMGSELNESMISSGCFEFDSGTAETSSILPDLLMQTETKLMKSDVENSNVSVGAATEEIGTDVEKVPDEMMSSIHSTFDTEIVYRRRVKKTPTKKAVKKRVSFHEDILKNTRTDNIHIEHGFVTYKGNIKKQALKSSNRYSWCSEYGSGQTNGDYDDEDGDSQQYVYRNACSDMLDYGQTEVFDTEEEKLNCIKYDNSGVFEYTPKNQKNNKKQLYKCECSSSNSSLDSGSSETNADANANQRKNSRNYAQAKSNSCECIGSNQTNNNVISDNCYYSEPNIEHLDEYNQNYRPKYSWSKEKKPKSSCLKKTKYTNMVMPEYDLNKKMKKFNVHHLTADMSQIFDNSKTIIGSLKDIFGMALPERGVPEGSEDLPAVAECIPETPDDTFTVIQKPRPFLSKSLDGVNKKNTSKKYVHNVDEQLRGKNDEDLYAPTRKNSLKDEEQEKPVVDPEIDPEASIETPYRNKYIINCESTVFEHTGVSFVYDQQQALALTPMEEPKPETTLQKISNIFKTGVFSSSSNNTSPTTSEPPKPFKTPTPTDANKRFEPSGSANTTTQNPMESSMTSSCSGISETASTSTNTTTTKDTSQAESKYPTATRSVYSPKRTGRHISSPMRQKTQTIARPRMSPDIFNMSHDRTSNNIIDDFDDILTITTTTSDQTDKVDDMVIVDYPAANDKIELPNQQYLRPPGMSSSSSKSSLINRFLRNVTQKKILEATIKKNVFFQTKLNSEKKLFGNLYVKGVQNCSKDMIEDMNAEIAMEIEENVMEKKRQSLVMSPDEVVEAGQFEGGVGEISIDLFLGRNLNIIRHDKEVLMKAFKLYTGYSREGYLTPVLVFLTDKTLYVASVVRNRLNSKFVLPYVELDVILMGPFGNTVLLSNSARDMQQVLLAGGPYPADGLVASLEICSRRGGFSLPAIGQLTLDHLAPLQTFVRENSSVAKEDTFKYYAVVNVPAGSLSDEKEPLGPYLKGFLMHRSLSHSGNMQQWSVGYFLLKAGVLYLFNDSYQKLPTWAVALAECQGARRANKTGRPHCFELLLRTGSLQLAAPDEYVASEWLQALVQAASGLFEMQDRHKSLGCTLVMTNNHLITLREDFSSPLKRNSTLTPSTSGTFSSPPLKENIDPNSQKKGNFNFHQVMNRFTDDCSEISSIRSIPSTPSKQVSEKKSNSTVSTPTKVSSIRQSNMYSDDKSYTNMTSFYGKDSGLEILTCAAIDDMISIKVPASSTELWCVLVGVNNNLVPI